MLWSLFKIVLFVAIVALLAIGVGYLLEMGDAIRIVVAGTEFTLRPLPALIVGIVLIVAAWLFVKLLGLLGAQPVEALGWDGDTLEAQGLAYLAVRSLLKLPLTLPSTTGAPRPLTGGQKFAP